MRPFVGKAVEIRGKVQASATDPLGRDIEPGAIRLDPSAVQPATPAAATQGSQPASASSQSTTSATSTATATSQAAGEWKNIYGELGWYKNQKDEEKVYEGTLEAVVREGPAKEPMAVRAFYKLGDRAIYVGPKRSPLLEKMIGKKVEIRGKLQEIMVDSTPIKEIWPGAVREQP